MRILYAVQATGNGHISRAIELLPFLNRYGETDVFLSGSNAQLGTDLPVIYRSKGLSLFYNEHGGLDYLRIVRQLNPFRIIRDAWNLPVESYDLIINDFETITSLACRLKQVNSVQFGHQASFRQKAVPRPININIAGEFVLSNYCLASAYFGLHFMPYNEQINWPVIKQRVRNATRVDRHHITVYLPHFKRQEIHNCLKTLHFMKFQVFSREIRLIEQEDNITWFPVDNEMFTQSMINCHGVITGAGFETPAEALFMGKKLMVIPIGGQYEQLCNAEALKAWNVPVVKGLNTDFGAAVHRWYETSHVNAYEPKCDTAEIVDWLMEKSVPYLNRPSFGYWPKRMKPAEHTAETKPAGQTGLQAPS